MSRPFRTGLLFALTVFSTFLASALFKPRQFRATALVTVEFASPELAAEASSRPVEAEHLLRSALLSPAFRAELTRAIDPPLQEDLAIATADGLAFLISAQHRDPKLAEVACNRAAERAAALAPELFATRWAHPPASAALHRAEPLIALASQNPGLIKSPQEQPPEVLAEWRALLQRLAEAPSAPQVESPPPPTARRDPAVASTSPVDSKERERLLLVGLIAALGTGIAAGLAKRATMLDVETLERKPMMHDSERGDPSAADSARPASEGGPNRYVISDLPHDSERSLELTGPPASGNPTQALPFPLVAPSNALAASSRGVVSRRTVALGSPVPPAPDPENLAEGASESRPPKDARPKSGGYSLVSSPPAASEVPIRLTDATISALPDPVLEPEAGGSLRRELYALGVQKCFVFGVTGPPGSRKQKVQFAAELAVLLAQPGHARVLLMEADFERPRVHQWVQLELPAEENLSSQLQREDSQIQADGWTVMRGTRSLHVLAESGTPATVPSLSGRFARCLDDLRLHYDFVILDGPPTEPPESLADFGSLVDGVFLVGSGEDAAELAAIAERFTTKRMVKAVRAV